MARKLRIEFPGAIYHVISRGNYRKDLFEESGSVASFRRALFSAAERCGWRIHAYVVMRNHFHLAVETPQGNLVAGMRWLQSTFANRFNRLHGEVGHVFQGRYKSLLIEPGQTLLKVVDYIHLNPVEAKICTLEELDDYAASSFTAFTQSTVPPPLCRESWLAALGLPDDLSAMKRYREHLAVVAAETMEEREARERRFHHGWMIGSADYRQAMLERFAEVIARTPQSTREAQEFREALWEREVQTLLVEAGKAEDEIAREPKSAPWKVAIARQLRERTTATLSWIAARLAMGHPSRVSNLIHGRV
ncbi:MAG: transposase [Opitutales bacterium]